MNDDIPEHDVDHSAIADLAADTPAVTEPKPEPEPEPEHESEDEAEPENENEVNLRIILQLYHQTFKKQLHVLAKELKPDALAKVREDELKKLRDKCDKLLCGVSSVSAMVTAFNAAIGLIEGTTTAIGYPTTGMTASLALDKHFQEVDLPRLALKYLDPRLASAEFSVAMKVLTTAFAQNQRVSAAKPVTTAPPAAGQTDLFSSL